VSDKTVARGLPGRLKLLITFYPWESLFNGFIR
jgi:hypothetical protein